MSCLLGVVLCFVLNVTVDVVQRPPSSTQTTPSYCRIPATAARRMSCLLGVVLCFVLNVTVDVVQRPPSSTQTTPSYCRIPATAARRNVLPPRCCFVLCIECDGGRRKIG